MSREVRGRASRWILRSMEWNDSRARYPNVWHEGMPRHVLATDRVASRLRLGDLIAVYYPTSARYPKRSERFLGLSRVVGLRLGDRAGSGWIDLETAHRLARPLEPRQMPRRVFMCCDPGWPERDVESFRAVFDAATAEDWQPREEERWVDEVPEQGPHPGQTEVQDAERGPEAAAGGVRESTPAPRDRARQASTAAVRFEPAPGERLFAGADYSGDMRDPRDGTWLALLSLAGEALRVGRLAAIGRSGLQASLRDPDRLLMDAEAIGLAFPFSLPEPFAETLIGGPFGEQGWWGLARRLERLSWPDYLVALTEFRDARGEIKRLADEQARSMSPLHRVDPDLGSRTYHGIRMIAEDRSRFAIRPFESAKGKLLVEVCPTGLMHRLGLPAGSRDRADLERILEALAALERYPVHVEGPHRQACLQSRDALDAVVAARCAAVAVLTEEADRSPEDLAPEQADRVRREGWIYGLAADPVV